MSDEPFGVGVVGCGRIGSRRATIAAGRADNRVVVVADSEVERATTLAASTQAHAVDDWRGVVEHPDVQVVIVSTTHDWLAPVSIAALDRGKHVLCEKPMGLDAGEAEEVVAAVRRSGCRLTVGVNHRHHPAVRRAHELAKAGAIGPLLFSRCRYGHGGRPGYGDEWRLSRGRSGGGELLDQGFHAIDLFRWFLGDLAEAIGMTSTWVWGADVEDNVFALFRSSRGQVASLHASWTQWKNLFSFEIFGERGALIVDGLGGSYGTECLTVHVRQLEGGPPREDRFEYPGPDLSWELEWDAWLRAIRSGQPPEVDAEDGLATLRLVDSVYQAARSGATVRLEPRLTGLNQG